MFRVAVICLLVVCLAAFAQAPTGIITGSVTDETGAVIPNVTVTITNKATGFTRTAQSNAEGLFSAPALPAGDYTVHAEASGFRTLQRDATVQAGTTTTVNLPMSLGEAKSVVTVEAASAQMNYDTHTVQGTIEQGQIRDLPLNGRQYMQLAQLEPGVTVTPGSTAQFNTLFNVSVLGAGNRTVFTVDGGNVSDNIDTAGGNSSMNFPQDVVQEFQLSSVNFDLSTPIASGGAINMVTRSGSNDWHGSAYFYYRDHNMSAYPALARSPLDPNPFFVRRNPGASIGGPIKKDKLFFFFNFEYMNQVQALAVQGNQPSVAALSGIFSSPYELKDYTFRTDYHLNDKNTMFLRYSHDGNVGFGDVFSNGNPSNWVTNTNWADQSIIGWTSTFTPNIVNDLRFQYNYWNNHNLLATPSECVPPACVGLAPAGTPISQQVPELLTILGTNFAFGNAAIGPNVNAPQARNTRRFELVETMDWQKGSHRFKFGADLNPTYSAGLWGFCTPACVGAYSPEFIRNTLTPAIGAAGVNALFPNLPTVIRSNQDLLNLPLLALNPGIFTGIGVGSVSTPAPYDYTQNKHYNQYRAFFQDTWKVTKNFTLNYGLAWNAQTGFYNTDLPKPAYLSPIYGNNLSPTNNNWHEMQPAVGFAWSPGGNQKWVIRGGGGIYWDSTPGYYKLREPAVIGPLGDGRVTLSPSSFTNEFPGIVNFSAGGAPLPVGAPIPISALTNMTVGQFMQILQDQLPRIQSLFPPNPPRSGPYTTTNVDVAKQGVEIYPPGSNPIARSYQTSIGVQHDFGHNLVISADWARRQGENVSLGELDVNLFNRYINGAHLPVIPACATPNFTPGVECSNGAITQWTDQGRSVYEGLLVKAQKRFSSHYQFIVSYALQNQNTMTAWNLANWGAGYGPNIPRHNLNVSGYIDLPWGFVLSVNSSILSRTPQEPVIGSIELPGTVLNTGSQALPGLPYSCGGISCGKSDLVTAVTNFNNTWAGQKDAKGATIPTLVLPQHYQFGDPTFSQDFRLTKNFQFKERYRLAILAEMFNAFNIANLTGYNFTLDTLARGCTLTNGAFATCGAGATQTYGFGQATQRAFQTFGSGGPRAVQLAARITF
ncbi:MAG TPA: carboxypeptidase regulatory-like domain-containing protein [Bryobacteraceae bacterium]|nr:carboxypeptidase regulatory-like domain-containing protein [Bryobacteraceae bacterium]